MKYIVMFSLFFIGCGNPNTKICEYPTKAPVVETHDDYGATMDVLKCSDGSEVILEKRVEN